MRTSEPTHRVFFALWPNEQQQMALAETAQGVSQAEGGRPVPALNFHVTLVFVGSVPEVRMQELLEIGQHVSTAARKSHEFGSAPLQLAFDAVEYWRKPKIFCAIASQPSAAASALSEVLKTSLVAARFSPDLKPFRAHVTLARKVPHPIAQLGVEPVLWSFTRFALIESRTQAQGSVYCVRESFRIA